MRVKNLPYFTKAHSSVHYLTKRAPSHHSSIHTFFLAVRKCTLILLWTWRKTLKFSTFNKAFLCQWEICGCTGWIVGDGFIAGISPGTIAEEGQRGLMSEADVWRAATQRGLEIEEDWNVTSYSGEQIPSIHSNWSPGNSSFLFRSKMAWNTKDRLCLHQHLCLNWRDKA